MATSGKRPQRTENFDYESQWDQPDEEEMTLPSGKKVLVRQPNMPKLAKAGKIPNHLLATVERFILGGMPMLIREMPALASGDSEPGAKLIKTGELDEYVDAICVAAIVRPVFVHEGEKGGIPISRLHSNDKFAVWDHCVGLTDALARFRQQRAGKMGDVESVRSGETVRDETEQSDRIEQPA